MALTRTDALAFLYSNCVIPGLGSLDAPVSLDQREWIQKLGLVSVITEDFPQLALQAYAYYAVYGVQTVAASDARTVTMLSMFCALFNIITQCCGKCCCASVNAKRLYTDNLLPTLQDTISLIQDGKLSAEAAEKNTQLTITSYARDKQMTAWDLYMDLRLVEEQLDAENGILAGLCPTWEVKRLREANPMHTTQVAVAEDAIPATNEEERQLEEQDATASNGMAVLEEDDILVLRKLIRLIRDAGGFLDLGRLKTTYQHRFGDPLPFSKNQHGKLTDWLKRFDCFVFFEPNPPDTNLAVRLKMGVPGLVRWQLVDLIRDAGGSVDLGRLKKKYKERFGEYLPYYKNQHGTLSEWLGRFGCFEYFEPNPPHTNQSVRLKAIEEPRPPQPTPEPQPTPDDSLVQRQLIDLIRGARGGCVALGSLINKYQDKFGESLPYDRNQHGTLSEWLGRFGCFDCYYPNPPHTNQSVRLNNAAAQ